MIYLVEYSKYNPELEYKKDLRRNINLDMVRKTSDYTQFIKLGFIDDTSHQQELNNTLKFTRSSNRQREKGHGKVFYTIHPSGKIRRYNPVKNKENPDELDEGNGNIIKDFGKPFKSAKDYKKGLRYLYGYIKRKEENGDYR